MTNRDHSPSVAQNDGGDAKLRTEGSGLDLDALEAVARAATDGPWKLGEGVMASGRFVAWVMVPKPKPPYPMSDLTGVLTSKADAQHIATFDPPTVLRLIARCATGEGALLDFMDLLNDADEANARLIEERRQLLAAAKALADHDCIYDGQKLIVECADHIETIRLISDLRVAIAKAEGRS